MNKKYRFRPFFTCIILLAYFSDLQAQQKRLTENEKKTLVANFSTVLTDVKNDFKSIANGEMKEWQGKKASASKVQLLPAYYELDKIYSIYYGMDELNRSEPNNYFLDISPFGIGEMYAALSATLKAKGFVEVQPQRAEAIDTIRAFRTKDAVVVIKGAKDMIDKKTSITIGKFYYYYSSNVLAIKPASSAIKNKNEFAYQHPCGLRASGRYIAGDTLIAGKIFYCTNKTNGPASFTGTYINNGYLPRTYFGNANGNLPMQLNLVKGQLDFDKWGVKFTGDFSPKVLPSDIIAKGYLKIGNDSVLGYLHDKRDGEPSFVFTPIDKNKKRIRFYGDYQESKMPKLVYENNTIAEEEKEWADIEQRIRSRQQNNGSIGSAGGTNNNSAGNAGMTEEATIARIALYDWIRINDKAREADVIQCAKDRGYGTGIARMSGHCKRADAYFKEHNDKCYAYLKKYEKYTPATQIGDIKARMKAVTDASNGMR